MYIEAVPNRNSPPAVLLREAYREDGKVKKRTLANISCLPAEVIEGLKVLLKGGVAVPSAEEVFTVERSLPHGHVAAVLGSARACGAEDWFGGAPPPLRKTLLAMVVARIVSPGSKLAGRVEMPTCCRRSIQAFLAWLMRGMDSGVMGSGWNRQG